METTQTTPPASHFEKIKTWAFAHKVISTIALIIVIIAVYEIVHILTTKPAPTRYVLGTASTGTIVSSVSDTGQITVLSQVNLTAQASGAITYVGVKAGDKVSKGQLLFAIDSTNAQAALDSAKLALAKLEETGTQYSNNNSQLTTLQAQNAIAQAEQSKVTADTAVQTALSNLLNVGYTPIPADPNDTETPPTVSGAYTGTQQGQIVITVYQSGSSNYFTATGLVDTVGAVDTTVPQPIGNSGLYIKFPSQGTKTTWTLNFPDTTASGYLNAYNAYQSALQNQQTTDAQADSTIAEQNATLTGMQNGVDPLDIQTQQLAIQQAENNLAQYSVFAPFDGVMSSVSAVEGAQASGTLGVIVTNQQVATVTMNEVDAAKVQIGQHATLSFDALPDLSMTGVVSEIDPVGTVSQGVVNYNVQISLDINNPDVKPGMSVTANIDTNIAADVLTVPTTAIKTQGGSSYVQELTNPDPAVAGVTGVTSKTAPISVPIQLGVSDGTNTEITSGLKDGDQIIVQTITASTTTTKTTSSAPSLLSGSSTRSLGGGGGYSGGRPGGN